MHIRFCAESAPSRALAVWYAGLLRAHPPPWTYIPQWRKVRAGYYVGALVDARGGVVLTEHDEELLRALWLWYSRDYWPACGLGG